MQFCGGCIPEINVSWFSNILKLLVHRNLISKTCKELQQEMGVLGLLHLHEAAMGWLLGTSIVYLDYWE